MVMTPREALALLQSKFPEAIVADGYCRDLVCGKPPKDIDAFVTQSFETVANLQALFPTMRAVVGSGYSDMREIDSVYEVPGLTTVPFSVIVLKPEYQPRGRVLLHDFGICQVFTDSDPDDPSTYRFTQAFHDDRAKEQFTLVTCEDNDEMARSMRRYERLVAEKYAGWELVIPKEFGVLYADWLVARNLGLA